MLRARAGAGALRVAGWVRVPELPHLVVGRGVPGSWAVAWRHQHAVGWPCREGRGRARKAALNLQWSTHPLGTGEPAGPWLLSSEVCHCGRGWHPRHSQPSLLKGAVVTIVRQPPEAMLTMWCLQGVGEAFMHLHPAKLETCSKGLLSNVRFCMSTHQVPLASYARGAACHMPKRDGLEVLPATGRARVGAGMWRISGAEHTLADEDKVPRQRALAQHSTA